MLLCIDITYRLNVFAEHMLFMGSTKFPDENEKTLSSLLCYHLF
ncbi:putative peptidase M16 domain-containing protein [Rosa chinensis]|uniref:Putative peptidase M16 domain-containing protein n=1 Tax=Rosa chinensis TaxID=74649 RepID=A0A2P6QKQ3_ROSCH|nr:putative peptidase M16 domain-containing protein [Rosa chinensis]